MTATATVTTSERTLKECLTAITEPTNEILARLQGQLFGNSQRGMSAYSRMHNRHNRS